MPVKCFIELLARLHITNRIKQGFHKEHLMWNNPIANWNSATLIVKEYLKRYDFEK